MSNLEKLKEALPFEFVEPLCICEFRIPYTTAALIIQEGFNPAPLPEGDPAYRLDILQSIARFVRPLHPLIEDVCGPGPIKATLEHVPDSAAYRLRIYRSPKSTPSEEMK